MKGERREPGEELDMLARRVIGAAIEVHRELGPGFLESVYQRALALEMGDRGLAFVEQQQTEVAYKGVVVGRGKVDFPVGGRLVVGACHRFRVYASRLS